MRFFDHDHVPTVDEARPCRCPLCHANKPLKGRKLMRGHGQRSRAIVERGTEKTSWVRRYRCNACGAIVQVGPEGILKGFLYTLQAIALAWVAVVKAPVGEGLSEDAAGDRHARGPLAVEKSRGGASRWRSLSRWASKIETWWPTRTVMGTTWRERVTSLLLGFVGDGGLEDLADRALAAHLAGGAIM
jgi:hypothetical protein